jgi:hypothetical protein
MSTGSPAVSASDQGDQGGPPSVIRMRDLNASVSRDFGVCQGERVSFEIERMILDEVNSQELGFPISGAELSKRLGLNPREVLAAAHELERKMRIGHNIFTVANEYTSGRQTDFIMSLEPNTAFDDPTEIEIRIGGPQNFDADQVAAIRGLKSTLEAQGYAVKFPRLITASVTIATFEAIGYYVALRAGEELTKTTIQDLINAAKSAFKRARATKSDEPKRTCTVFIADKHNRATLHEFEIEGD